MDNVIEVLKNELGDLKARFDAAGKVEDIDTRLSHLAKRMDDCEALLKRVCERLQQHHHWDFHL